RLVVVSASGDDGHLAGLVDAGTGATAAARSRTRVDRRPVFVRVDLRSDESLAISSPAEQGDLLGPRGVSSFWSDDKPMASPDHPDSTDHVAPDTWLFDVDNTLLDNDVVTADLRSHLERTVGSERAQRYWQFFEELRTELGYADYLGALQRYRLAYPRDLRLLEVSYYLTRYPFSDR